MEKSAMVIMAHPDDEILGCGGSLKKLSAKGYRIHALFLSDGVASREITSCDTFNALKSRREAAKMACEIIGIESISFGDFPDNQLDCIPLLKINKRIELEIDKFQPSLIFTHHDGDLNIDHRLVNQAVLVATRPQKNNPVKTILACEIPSSTEWNFTNNRLFSPNWFIDISDTLESKCLSLLKYENELRAFPHPRSIEAIKNLAAWRGATIGTAAAEAFMLCRNIE